MKKTKEFMDLSHSSASAERSAKYHKSTIMPNAVRHSSLGSMKTTRLEQNPQSEQDVEERLSSRGKD